MVSHRKIGGVDVSIGGGGLRFKKRPSAFNICIGKAMKGQPGPIHGGRGRGGSNRELRYVPTTT